MSEENFDLMTTRDVCRQLCVTSRTIDRYRKRDKESNPFPDPDCSYMGGPNKWLKSKVVAWQKAEMQRQTRPPMSHINLPRDERGRLSRSASA